MIRAALAYALIAAAANLLGAAAVAMRRGWSVRALDHMIALAGGFLVSVSLTGILPEAIERGGPSATVVALIGYLLVHLTQHTFATHFHFGEETHEVSELVGFSALAGLLLHTFVDGVAIASGFAVSEALGILIFIGILLHKFPEGLAVSSLFLAAGAGRGRALAAGAALGLATVAGVLLTDAIPFLAEYGLGLSAGVTLYVAASNLVPEFQNRPGVGMQITFFVGCAAYLVARMLVGHG